MTAGKGVCHSEMFPLIEGEKDNALRFFQIWLNLPARSKMATPGFAMFWRNTVPKWEHLDGNAAVTLWAGAGYLGVDENNRPPKDSWATDPANDVAIFHVVLQPGGKVTLPRAKIGADASRSLYYVEGGAGMEVDGTAIGKKVVLNVDAARDLDLALSASAKEAGEFLVLQGRPIKEPVSQYGPFVMNTQSEIQQAFSDYQQTKFGGWPWPRDDMVFPREKKRFAKLNGTELLADDDESCSV
mmetsp:Transcript_20641/g.50898  ORF Transcript_20641/g.50898 Transcript_20641/m.50898 type:complete len:242 (-) Transcript_20641:499-1224(-)